MYLWCTSGSSVFSRLYELAHIVRPPVEEDGNCSVSAAEAFTSWVEGNGISVNADEPVPPSVELHGTAATAVNSCSPVPYVGCLAFPLDEPFPPLPGDACFPLCAWLGGSVDEPFHPFPGDAGFPLCSCPAVPVDEPFPSQPPSEGFPCHRCCFA